MFDREEFNFYVYFSSSVAIKKFKWNRSASNPIGINYENDISVY
jgi:hypothetical protein